MKITEISYASELDISGLNFHEILSNSTEMGEIDGKSVVVYVHSNQELFMIADNNSVEACILITDKKYLRGIQAFIKKGGIITALMTFVVRKLHRTLVIRKDEGLTHQGLLWLEKIINSGGRGLIFKDQNGNIVDTNLLKKEWASSFETDTIGDTEIVITGDHLKEALFPEKRLMTLTKFVGDKQNL